MLVVEEAAPMMVVEPAVEEEPMVAFDIAMTKPATNLRGAKTEEQAQEAVREEPEVGIDAEEDRD